MLGHYCLLHPVLSDVPRGGCDAPAVSTTPFQRNGVMSRTDSTPAPAADKTKKPNPNFPLFPHTAGVWAKKIRGKLHYLGTWDEPDGALAKYNAQKEALHAGRKPREEAEGYTVKML